ncbi:MAG: restriction endonuclease [Nocardioidaceae bacterium]
MATNYSRGAAFERAVRDLLETDGYVVSRSAGSRSKVDLIGLKPGQILLVQVKKYGTGTVSPGERAGLLRIANAAGPTAVPVIAYKRAPRQPIEFVQLTGPLAVDKVHWTPDEVATEVSQ